VSMVRFALIHCCSTNTQTFISHCCFGTAAALGQTVAAALHFVEAASPISRDGRGIRAAMVAVYCINHRGVPRLSGVMRDGHDEGKAGRAALLASSRTLTLPLGPGSPPPSIMACPGTGGRGRGCV
jgi:hypothetical protein